MGDVEKSVQDSTRSESVLKYRVEFIHPEGPCVNSGKKAKETHEATATYSKAFELATQIAPTCLISGCGIKYLPKLTAKK